MYILKLFVLCVYRLHNNLPMLYLQKYLSYILESHVI
jgi:hypothetical protein